MPELPDVELYKRHLDATCLGRTIRRVTVGDARILAEVSAAELARRLEGARMTASRRHGKHLLVDVGPPGWLTLHFGMNGSLKHFTDGESDPTYDRVRFDFAGGHHLAYVNPRLLGRVGLAPNADAFIAAEGLGPDALDPRFDLATFELALDGRKRDIKSLLMDQEVLAGVGNIYSDEILFQAGINPRTRCDRLDAGARRRLFGRIKEVLETAIASGAGAEQLVDRLPGSFLIPHRQKGGRCPRCGGEIASAKFSGRTAYYCPRCQPEPA
jgi:formamidopyrimidine-DNA glycosylase